jgi:hypothetical protein
LDAYIAQLIRLGYQVGVAQDHSDNPDVEFDHVYAVNGFGVQTHVTDEAAMKGLVESHDERVAEMAARDERRLAEARSSAE